MIWIILTVRLGDGRRAKAMGTTLMKSRIDRMMSFAMVRFAAGQVGAALKGTRFGAGLTAAAAPPGYTPRRMGSRSATA